MVTIVMYSCNGINNDRKDQDSIPGPLNPLSGALPIELSGTGI